PSRPRTTPKWPRPGCRISWPRASSLVTRCAPGLMCSTASTPSSSAPKTALAWCVTRSPANRQSWPRPTNMSLSGRNTVRSSTCRASRTPASGNPNPQPSISGSTDMQTIDLATTTLRELNATLQATKGQTNATAWEITNPKGSHALAVGLDAPIEVTVRGSTGYYTAGMNKQASVTVKGSAGPGVAENMMSGTVIIEGDASQYAGATGNGGLLIIKGNASSRCGISMKGINIV